MGPLPDTPPDQSHAMVSAMSECWLEKSFAAKPAEERRGERRGGRDTCKRGAGARRRRREKARAFYVPVFMLDIKDAAMDSPSVFVRGFLSLKALALLAASAQMVSCTMRNEEPILEARRKEPILEARRKVPGKMLTTGNKEILKFLDPKGWNVPTR